MATSKKSNKIIFYPKHVLNIYVEQLLVHSSYLITDNSGQAGDEARRYASSRLYQRVEASS